MSLNGSLGIKLEMDFFNHPGWQKVFAGVENPFREIANLGLKSVEFSLKPGFEQEELRLLLDRCLNSGLKMNLHPYTEGEHNPACFENSEGNVAREIARGLLEVSHRISKLQKRRTALIFHGASTAEARNSPWAGEDRRFFQERTNRFFKWLEGYVKEKELNVLIVSELQIAPLPEEGFLRIGDSYREVLETVEGTNLGLCWDTGHTYFAHLRKGISLIPPPAFVQKVRHVHLHDVRGGEDHQPLLAGTIPLREYLMLLRKFNFSGDITLEFSPSAIASYGKFGEVIQECLKRVEEALS